jgi:predicted Fe-S protein YdhL (DUF1289 family)
MTPDDPYDSPCIRECVLDLETKVCRGCGRTLREIERWVDFTPEEREAIRKRLAQRNPRGE